MQCYASKRGWSALIVIALVLVFGPCVPAPEAHAQSGPVVEIVHVNIDREWPSNDPEDGETWITAYRFLQDGLAKADDLLDPVFGTADRVEIWVAAGVYKPTTATCNTPPCQAISFNLRDNVRIYGGFAGTEQENEFDLRDWEQNVTVLCGDLLANDEFLGAHLGTDGFVNYEDNSRHVVRAVQIGETARLDGFTIRGGHVPADGGALGGGGILIHQATPIIQNCIIRENLYADSTAPSPGAEAILAKGGGVHVQGAAWPNPIDSRPRLVNCRIESTPGRCCQSSQAPGSTTGENVPGRRKAVDVQTSITHGNRSHAST
jgi:hypothetical protein